MEINTIIIYCTAVGVKSIICLTLIENLFLKHYEDEIITKCIK